MKYPIAVGKNYLKNEAFEHSSMGAPLKSGYTVAPILSPIQRSPQNVIVAFTFFIFVKVLDWYSAKFSIDVSLLPSKTLYKTLALTAK